MIDRKWERMRWDIVLLVLLRMPKQKKKKRPYKKSCTGTN